MLETDDNTFSYPSELQKLTDVEILNYEQCTSSFLPYNPEDYFICINPRNGQGAGEVC